MAEAFKDKHPIQLQNIKVMELSLVVKSDTETNDLPETGDFKIGHGHSEYDPEGRDIAVSMGFKIEEDDENYPFHMSVRLIGVFSVGDRFPLDHIERWATGNAPLLLYPFLREHVYSLTIRAGYTGMILPLFTVPTFRLEEKNLDTEK